MEHTIALGRGLTRGAALAAVGVGLLSLAYAVFFLVVTPAAQRGADLEASFTSYQAEPTGLRVASLCLFASGLLTTVVFTALHALPGTLGTSLRTWALALGVVSGVATAVHGLTDLINLDKEAHSYVGGDPATQAAVRVTHAMTSAVDPRGLATFGLAGIVVFTFSRHLRERSPLIGLLGQVLGVDMVLLFIFTALGSGIPTLITAVLAAVVLGPVWWFAVAARLYRTG